MKVLIILFIILVSYLILSFIGNILYKKYGFGKRLFHDIYKWHVPDNNIKKEFDGASIHAKCKYCGEDIMQDSQGNWF